MTRVSRTLAVIAASAMTANCSAVSGLSVTHSSLEDFRTAYSDVMSGCTDYVQSLDNGDGSFGDTGTINDTVDAMGILRMSSSKMDIMPIHKWVYATGALSNTDTIARHAAESGDNSLICKVILDQQNSDGGWGITEAYSSDVYDTLLVLDYIARNGATSSWAKEPGEKAVEYIFSQMKEDGSLAYNANAESSSILTAMAVYDIAMFDSNTSCEDAEHVKKLEQMAGYLKESAPDTYTEKTMEAAVWRDIALYQYGGSLQPADLLEKLKNAQNKNGSFADSIHCTNLAVRLLNMLSPENMVQFSAVKTELSNSGGKAGEAQSVTAVTDISYTASVEAVYTLRMNVENDGKTVYTNSTNITLDPKENAMQVQAGTFRLIDEAGSVLRACIDLCDGDTIIKREVFDLTIEEGRIAASAAEISGYEISLDSICGLEGTPSTVTAAGRIAYAANKDISAELKTGVYKGKELIKENTRNVSLRMNSIYQEAELITVDIPADEAGVYTFRSECIYEGDTVFTSVCDYEIIAPREPATEAPTEAPTGAQKPTEAKDPEEPTEAPTEAPTEPEEYCDILWFSPLLSNMMVYAGQETLISGKAAIVYDSNTDFSGTVTFTAVRDGETVCEESAEIDLPAQDLLAASEQIVDGKSASMPQFRTGDIISFIADEPGKITVTAVLTDKDGKKIAEADKTVEIISKPVQDLVFVCEKSEDGSYIDMNWNNISTEHEKYNYQLYRREEGKGWEIRPIWNETDHIRVLNVYPAGSSGKGYGSIFEEWMKEPLDNEDVPAGKNIFDIGSVYFADFNKDPVSYMKNSDGSWKYDVVYFGAWDCNGHFDLNDESYAVMQEFADSGRGILFGHDTLCPNFGHYNFSKFADQLGLLVKKDETNIQARSVSVMRIGTLTNYPWEIRGTLEIPSTHTFGQFIGGKYDAIEWMTLNTTQLIDEESGAHSNFYLATKNNLGMIQTGHSGGAASDDERKVLANTIFYLYQLTEATSAVDRSFYDLAAPDKPTAESSISGGDLVIKAGSKDNGTVYDYSLVAVPYSEDGKSISSDITSHEAISGLAGFVAVASPSDKPDPGLLEYDENNEHVQNITAADKNGTAAVKLSTADLDAGSYIHLFAVDKADNVSEELIIPVSGGNLSTEIKTDKSDYAPGETVAIDTETVSEKFGLTADCTVEIRDEFGNLTAAVSENKDTQLEADKTFASAGTWEIPAEQHGRYKAVISWTKEGRLLASAEAKFKIAGSRSITDDITSDRKVYDVTDPINLRSVVYNQSSDLVENDLVLDVTVYDSGSKPVEQFSRTISSMNPQADIDFSDAVAARTLKAGEYTAVAVVTQDGKELASDTAAFSVEEKKETVPDAVYAEGTVPDKAFFFSHDHREFDKSILSDIRIITVIDGKTTGSAPDPDKLVLRDDKKGKSCPHDVYAEEQTDFAYSITAFYNGIPLLFKDGTKVGFTAYIGVKGDADLNNLTDSVDASAVLNYYAKISTGGKPEDTLLLGSTDTEDKAYDPEELAAFLADVDKDVYSEENHLTRKAGRSIDSSDASSILAYYAFMSTGETDREAGWNAAVSGREESMAKMKGDDGDEKKE